MRTAERRDGREWKRIELQLDTAQILIVVVMLFGLCAASFYLGRWMERDRWSESTTKTVGGASKIVDSGAGDLTFFDTLGDRAAEPSRQARSEVRSQAPAPAGGHAKGAAGDADAAAEGPDLAPEAPAHAVPASPAAHPRSTSAPPVRIGQPGKTSSPALAAPGSYALQVFAGDKSQAEKIAASLVRKGYEARVLAGGTPSTARVRVGGYSSKTEADQAASRLRKDAHLKPWVLKAD